MAKYPKILSKSFKALSVLDNSIIIQIVRDTVTNGINDDTLIGNVSNILLGNECIMNVNDGSYSFKKALLIRVKLVVQALDFKYETKNSASMAKDGGMYIHTTKEIVNQRDKEEYAKIWFKEAKAYQNNITLKGSKLVVDNNSDEVLYNKSSILMEVRDINPLYLDIYASLLYEANKGKVDEPNYKQRLQEVANETKNFMGYQYENFRKLDSNSRNYPLSRFGFAYEYGDAFEKFLIVTAKKYLVTENEISEAIAYLEDEFGVDNYEQLVADSMKVLDKVKKDYYRYVEGKNVSFSIDGKSLGKHLHIVDVYRNIINNINDYTNSWVGYDYTNSGGINASNQFGDEQLLKMANLLGGDKAYDTHQEIANYLGIARKDAKLYMQGPNHGGEVLPENSDMVNAVFGENYKYIRLMAEYGKKLADNGVKSIEIVRPDGVKAIWNPYTLDCSVAMEDGTFINAVMPYGGNGTDKNLGLAVSILHSADSYTEHYVQMKLLEDGYHIRTILDNFLGAPSIKRGLIKYTFESLEILRGYAERSLKSIEEQTGIYRGWTLPERTIELVPSANII